MCLAALVVGAYWGSFDGKFVFDDLDSIVGNPYLRPGLSAGQTLEGLLARQRPVVDATFLINYRLGGVNPWGYHLVNLVIHVLAACVLFGLMRRVLSSPAMKKTFGSAAGPLALAIAAVWAVHPLQTEAVTYIVQRGESLCSLLYLLTLYCVVRGHGSPRRRWWFIAAVAACAVGMGAKQIMVTAPPAALLIDAIVLSGSFRSAPRRSWGLYIGLACTWLIVAAMLVWIPSGTTAGFATLSFTWQSYLVTEMGVLVKYLGLIFWPARLCIDYWWWPRTFGEVLPQTILVVILLAGVAAMLVARPPWRLAGLCGALFFLVLAPTSSFVPINDACVEHRLYLPLAAMTAMVIGGLYVLARRACSMLNAGKWVRAVVAVVVLGVLAPLTAGTAARNRLYSDPAELWRAVVIDQRDNPRACLNLGVILAAQGRNEEALSWYNRALELKPNYAEALNNTGICWARKGEPDQAIVWYRRAVERLRAYPQAWYNLGLALSQAGREPEAIEAFRTSLKYAPLNADAHRDLGLVLLGTSRPDEAMEEFRAAYSLNADPLMLVYIAQAFMQQNNLPEAVKYCLRALEADPKLFEAHLELGNALARQDRIDDAIGHLVTAVTLRHSDGAAHFYLGRILLRVGDFSRAVGELRLATELDPNAGPAWFTLGVAYEQAAQPAEAITCFRKAIKIMPDFAPSHLHLGVALEEQDRLDEAIESYRQAIKLKPEFPEAQSALTKALAKKEGPRPERDKMESREIINK